MRSSSPIPAWTAPSRPGDDRFVTDTASALRQVTAWFDTVGTAGLQLPNGWFGRPYDNRHELTWSQARPHKLLLELDAQLLLVLTDPGEPTTQDRDLCACLRQGRSHDSS